MYECYAPALLHEANVEREFTSAKGFQTALRSVGQDTLSLFMFISGGIGVYKPSTAEIRAEYDRRYRAKSAGASAASSADGASAAGHCGSHAFEDVDSDTEIDVGDDDSSSDDEGADCDGSDDDDVDGDGA